MMGVRTFHPGKIKAMMDRIEALKPQPLDVGVVWRESDPYPSERIKQIKDDGNKPFIIRVVRDRSAPVLPRKPHVYYAGQGRSNEELERIKKAEKVREEMDKRPTEEQKEDDKTRLPFGFA